MIKSMTGYGTARYTDDSVEIVVEVKTLNSKFLDLNIRTGKNFSDKEMEVRNLVSDLLIRGKVSVTIDYQPNSGSKMAVSYNKELFQSYYSELKGLSEMVGDNGNDVFRIAVQLPEVVINNTNEKELEAHWGIIKKVLTDAIAKCDTFRIDEGKALGVKLLGYIQSIKEGLKKIEVLDPERILLIRKRITENLEKFIEEEMS